MKICFKCKIEKPLSEYYKHKQMSDGHLNKCKDCTKNDTKKRTNELCKDQKWLEKERARHRDKYHRLEYNSKHRPTPVKAYESTKKYRQMYPEKYKAKIAAQRIPILIKGNHRHHWSYNEEHYKDVIELSVKDHNTIHRHITYDQERMMYRVAIKFGLWEVGTLLDTRERSENYYKEVLFN